MTNATAALTADPTPQAAPHADAGTAAVSQSAPATPQAAPSGEWYSGIQNETTRTWAQAKGWKDPLAAVESAYNLEKLIGFDKAGRTLVIPGEDATPEQRAAFNAKLGVPEKSDGYKLPIPEGAPEEFSKAAANWFHKHGVPAKAAEGIVGEWNEYQAQEQAKLDQQRSVQSTQEFDEVKSEWGAAYNERIELTRRGLVQFLPAASGEERAKMMDAIEGVMGTKNFLKFGYAIGSGLGEHKMHEGSGSGVLTPAQASQKIAELKSNKEWANAYLNGDKAKAKEINDLFTLANAGGQS